MVGRSGMVMPPDEWEQIPRIQHKRHRGATVGANLLANILGGTKAGHVGVMGVGGHALAWRLSSTNERSGGTWGGLLEQR